MPWCDRVIVRRTLDAAEIFRYDDNERYFELVVVSTFDEGHGWFLRHRVKRENEGTKDP